MPLAKKCLSSLLPIDLEGFDLIIFENLGKSLKYVCDGVVHFSCKFLLRINYKKILGRKFQSLHCVYAPFRLSLLTIKQKKHCYALILHFLQPYPVTLLKNKFWYRFFANVNFTKFLRTNFLIEHLWSLLVHCLYCFVLVLDFLFCPPLDFFCWKSLFLEKPIKHYSKSLY